MAHGPDRKAELIAQLARDRTRMSGHARRVQESLDVGARLKASVGGRPGLWLGGAALAGLVLARFRPRKSTARDEGGVVKTAARASLLWPVVKIAFDLARPTLVSLLTARLADFAATRSSSFRGERR